MTKVKQESAYLFNTGQSFQSYDFMGLHLQADGSYTLRVWAPNAKAIAVVGDFNDWEPTIELTMLADTGVWEVNTQGLQPGDHYKIQVTGLDDRTYLKIDPYARQFEKKPGVAAIVPENDEFKWHDGLYMGRRKRMNHDQRPLNVYEVHLGSWRRNADDSYYTYEQLADELIPYVKELGYTHIEILPITEHVLDASWGYQTFGYFAPTSRHGNWQEFLTFVDRLHAANVGIIADFVPGHFIKNYDALYEYDGTATFEPQDKFTAKNVRWGTWNFDLGKPQVQSFLVSSAMFWLKEAHIDGLRIDGVTNMIYLDQDEGKDHLRNEHGDNRDLAAIAFMQKLNGVVKQQLPDVMMIAEESSPFKGITKPTQEGGLGFDYKWNMGWMNDTLKFFEMDPLYRKDNFNLLTFSFMYMYDEKFILPLSHDEVVHGKKSLMHKMFGDRYNQFASLRLLFAYLTAHPGKQLLFMGSEWGQFLEWRDYSSLEWQDLADEMNRQMSTYTNVLNHVYAESKALFQQDDRQEGLIFTNTDDAASSTMTFIRQGVAPRDFMVTAFNFVPVEKRQYKIGVPYPGTYEVALNTEDEEFGGTWTHIETTFKTEAVPYKGQPYSFDVTLPATGALYIKPKRISMK